MLGRTTPFCFSSSAEIEEQGRSERSTARGGEGRGGVGWARDRNPHQEEMKRSTALCSGLALYQVSICLNEEKGRASIVWERSDGYLEQKGGRLERLECPVSAGMIVSFQA